MKWELLNSLDLNGRRFSASKDSLKSLLFVFTCLVHCLQLLCLIQFHHFGAAWKWGKSCFNCNCFDLSASHKHMFSSRWALRNLHEWHDMKLLTICFWFRMRDIDSPLLFRRIFGTFAKRSSAASFRFHVQCKFVHSQSVNASRWNLLQLTIADGLRA